jgi:[protein-PII] uridylyltransferase
MAFLEDDRPVTNALRVTASRSAIVGWAVASAFMGLERGPLLADETLSGRRWCRAHSELVDGWLSELMRQAAAAETSGLSLVAVGGYGRAELCPRSDIDVMLVHDRRIEVAEIAERLWYPVWQQELHLGHSVSTVRDALRLGTSDLDTATALLSARHVAGDPAPVAELSAGAFARWRRRSKHVLPQLAERVERRHEKTGEVGFRSEPNLKEGRGGLRDVHALRWAEAAQDDMLFDEDAAVLDESYAMLLDARVELQRLTARPTNVLALEHQAGVAAALGLSGADELMARIAEAARAIAWTSDDAWRRLASVRGSPLGQGTRAVVLEAGLRVENGQVALDDGVPANDLTVVLRAAATAARLGVVIERRSLERLAAAASPWVEPWSADARHHLVELLRTGSSAIGVIESLDRRGVWGCVLPEWLSVRSLPQPDAFHDFTVDRHLLETAAAAARLARRVSRPDLLLTAALLHDIGKGSAGDHTEAGVVLAGRVCRRMGFAPDDVSTVSALVEHHLLLRDVASRRDIEDPATAERVAGAVGSIERLRLLAALTEADGRATGPSAWDPWTAELLARLVGRVTRRLRGRERGRDAGAAFPTADQLARLMAGDRWIEVSGDVLTVMTADRPGVFSRVAGVLALHGLDVLAAAAYSTRRRALAEFRVTDPLRDEPPWSRVTADLELALDGRLALEARLSERARTYGRARRGAIGDRAPTVGFDDRASVDATVIDVQAADGIGVLYRITRALAELDLDIRSAKVQTLGERVHDAFYVRGRDGKVTDARTIAEIERAILHSLAE